MKQITSAQKGQPNRISFTEKALAKIPIPAAGTDGQVRQIDYHDETTPGLTFRVSSTGAKSWCYVTRVQRNGTTTPDRTTFGGYPQLTLSQVRGKALELEGAIAQGIDPREIRQQKATGSTEGPIVGIQTEPVAGQSQTVLKTIEQFLKGHHPKHKDALKPATLRRYRSSLMGQDVEPLHNRSIASVTEADVIKVLNRIEARGRKIEMNRCLTVLNRLFWWAKQHGLIPKNPATDIEARGAETKRDRHLCGNRQKNRTSEIGLVWKAADKIGSFGGALVKLMILTGQRENEVARMERSSVELIDLDGTDPRWLIPGFRTKNGRDNMVPLTPLMISIIQKIPKISGSPFVFTTVRPTKDQKPHAISNFSQIKRDLDTAIAALKVEDPKRYGAQRMEKFWLHDLRRSFITGNVELGALPELVESLVNHTLQGVAGRYQFAEYWKQKRETMEKWSAHIQNLTKGN